MNPLSPEEVRVLGALIEKDMATPEYYPLTLNALVNACNQKSNRDPVVSYDEQTVAAALEGLRQKKLALETTGREHRVPKHRHRISETLNLGNRELAVLCELMLRGPQTAGELRSRAQRLYNFDDLEAVETCLQRLQERDPEPLVARLTRQAGSREPRYAHRLSGEPVAPEEPAVAPADSLTERIAGLEAEVESLKAALQNLEERFAGFRSQFE